MAAKHLFQSLLAVGILLISLSANADVATYKPINPADPYEPFNRVMYNINEFIDKYALKPIARLYNKIIPKPINKGVSNIFNNLDNVPTVVNDVLQANFYQASSDAWRLTINSTVGIAGFFDVASDIGLEPNVEDFGLTLAAWGFKDSNYLVLPLLGPSTVRDAMAWPVNYEYMTIYPYIYPIKYRYIMYGVSVVSKRANYLRYQEVLKQASLDKYVFMRNAYMQRRAYQINRNKELGDPYTNKDSILEKSNFEKNS